MANATHVFRVLARLSLRQPNSSNWDGEIVVQALDNIVGMQACMDVMRVHLGSMLQTRRAQFNGHMSLSAFLVGMKMRQVCREYTMFVPNRRLLLIVPHQYVEHAIAHASNVVEMHVPLSISALQRDRVRMEMRLCCVGVVGCSVC